MSILGRMCNLGLWFNAANSRFGGEHVFLHRLSFITKVAAIWLFRCHCGLVSNIDDSSMHPSATWDIQLASSLPNQPSGCLPRLIRHLAERGKEWHEMLQVAGELMLNTAMNFASSYSWWVSFSWGTGVADLMLCQLGWWICYVFRVDTHSHAFFALVANHCQQSSHL